MIAVVVDYAESCQGPLTMKFNISFPSRERSIQVPKLPIKKSVRNEKNAKSKA